MDKPIFDTITPKMVLGQLFKSCNVMKIVHLKTNSYAVHKATDNYVESLFDLVDELCEVHFGTTGKKEIDEIPSAKYIDPKAHLNDIGYYLERNRSLFKASEEQNIIDEIQAVISKTKYLLTLE